MKVVAAVMLAVAVMGGVGTGVARAEAAAATSRPAVEGEGFRGPFARLEVLHKLLSELNLTDDQKAQIKEIVGPYHKELMAWKDANAAELEKLQAAFKAAREAKDRAAVKDAMEKLKALVETAPKPQGLLEKIKAVLTPEQWEKAKEVLKDWREEGPGKGK